MRMSHGYRHGTWQKSMLMLTWDFNMGMSTWILNMGKLYVNSNMENSMSPNMGCTLLFSLFVNTYTKNRPPSLQKN
jgi:hypothetical protein